MTTDYCRQYVTRAPVQVQCGLPVEVYNRFEHTDDRGGVVFMRAVRCPRGHWYHEIDGVLEPEALLALEEALWES